MGLAERREDQRTLAAGLREIAMIDFGRVRAWFAAEIMAGHGNDMLAAVASGVELETLLADAPIAPLLAESTAYLDRALGIFERLGDRTGVMSTVIAMAYVRYAPAVHLSSSARHLEEIRRVTSRLSEAVTESERARLDLQMLFGVHVFARAKVVPDVALTRGEDAYRAARLEGDRTVEFLAAGGVALTLLELGDIEGAEKWLGQAAAAASMAPSSTRARQLETWRGIVRAAQGDPDGAVHHLEHAVTMATESGGSSARCETLARLALVAAGLVGEGEGGDMDLAALVEDAAGQVQALTGVLPGHAPWGAQADAALATLALRRGDVPAAVAAGGAALEALQTGLHEDASLEIVLPAARALLAGGPPEVQDFVRGYLRTTLTRIAQGILDEPIRVRWLKGPVGRELVELAGPIDAPRAVLVAGASAKDSSADVDEADRQVLRLLTEGRTNAEIAAELQLDEDDVVQRLARLQAQLGASSRSEATSLAFRGLAAVGSR